MGSVNLQKPLGGLPFLVAWLFIIRKAERTFRVQIMFCLCGCKKFCVLSVCLRKTPLRSEKKIFLSITFLKMYSSVSSTPPSFS